MSDIYETEINGRKVMYDPKFNGEAFSRCETCGKDSGHMIGCPDWNDSKVVHYFGPSEVKDMLEKYHGRSTRVGITAEDLVVFKDYLASDMKVRLEEVIAERHRHFEFKEEGELVPVPAVKK